MNFCLAFAVPHRGEIFPANLPVPTDVHLLENFFNFVRHAIGVAMPTTGGSGKDKVVLAGVLLYYSQKLMGGFGIIGFRIIF